MTDRPDPDRPRPGDSPPERPAAPDRPPAGSIVPPAGSGMPSAGRPPSAEPVPEGPDPGAAGPAPFEVPSAGRPPVPRGGPVPGGAGDEVTRPLARPSETETRPLRHPARERGLPRPASAVPAAGGADRPAAGNDDETRALRPPVRADGDVPGRPVPDSGATWELRPRVADGGATGERPPADATGGDEPTVERPRPAAADPDGPTERLRPGPDGWFGGDGSTGSPAGGENSGRGVGGAGAVGSGDVRVRDEAKGGTAASAANVAGPSAAGAKPAAGEGPAPADGAGSAAGNGENGGRPAAMDGEKPGTDGGESAPEGGERSAADRKPANGDRAEPVVPRGDGTGSADPVVAAGGDHGSAGGGGRAATERGSVSGDHGERAARNPDDDRPDAPKRKLTTAGALIWVLLALLGYTLVVQLRSNNDDQGLATARQEDLVSILSDLESRDSRLQSEIQSLETSQRQLTSGVSSRQAALAEAEKRADELGLLAGTLPGRGPGLKIVIDKVRASAILNAVEELRGAGGEVMELAGSGGPAVRIVASSYFVDAEGGGIDADGTRLTGPWTLWVIGSPPTMQTALQIPGGVVASVNGAGGSVTMEAQTMVEVTAVRKAKTLQYARPAS